MLLADGRRKRCTGSVTASGTTAMVGRDRELGEVRRLVEAAIAGAGGALLITGEAGIGKSRMLAETVALARAAGFAVLSGRAVPGGGTYRPVADAVLGRLRGSGLAETAQLRPFRAALARLAPGWMGADLAGTGTGAPDSLHMLGEGLLQLLVVVASDGAGSLLVLDDLHWADPDTIALVEYVASAARSSKVLLAVSARDDQPGLSPDPRDSAAGRLQGRDGVTTVRLRRLDDRAVMMLASACAAHRPVSDEVLAALVERADGLPVLVEELLGGLLDAPGAPGGVPPTLTELVGARIAALDTPSQQVLGAAAVLGVEPDWALLPLITGQDEDAVLTALRAATGAGLLVPAAAELRWPHALTRDAVLQTLLAPQRAALAGRAADVLTERAGPGDDALAADLLANAGAAGRAVTILVHLARRDTARGALRSATGLIDRAVAIGATPAQVAMGRVRLLTLQGRISDALSCGGPVLAEATGDAHAELCLELARAAVSGGRWVQAQHYVERAGRPADPRSAVLLAEASFGAGDIERAARLAGLAVDASERAGRPDAMCAALLVAGRCAALTTPAAATAAFGRAAQCAAEHGLVPLRVQALFGLGLIQLMDRAEPGLLAEARELALDAGLLTEALSIEVILADHTMTVDGPVAAEPLARRTADTAARLQLSGLQALAETFAAGARAVVGDTAGMSAVLDAAVTRADTSVEVATLASAVRALAHLVAHDLQKANTHLDRGMTALIGHGPAAPLVFWGLWALLRTAVGDRGEQAREYLRSAPAGLRDTNRAALAYADAVVAGRAGRGDAAGALMATANAILDGQPWWRRLLRLLVLEAAVLDGWGDPVPALRADLTVFERTGEHQLARTARDLLRQAGAPTRRGRGDAAVPPALRALGVTSREMDVLVLVADGLTNAEVGRRLFLSPRTVESHVARLLAKTGTASRAELREYARPTA